MTLDEQIEAAQGAHKRVWEAQLSVSQAVQDRAALAWRMHQEHGLSWRKIARLIGMSGDGGGPQLWREVLRHITPMEEQNERA